jgi:hypothetical protein
LGRTTGSDSNPSYLRPHLRRNLVYRPHLLWLFYYGFALGIFMILSPLLLLFGQSQNYVSTSGQSLFIFCALGLSLLFLIQFFFKPIAFSQVHIDKDGLKIESLGSIQVIAFTEVQKVTFQVRFLLSKGFTLILKNGKKIPLSMSLERNEYVLENLASYNLSLFETDDLEFYRRRLILFDHSNARLADALKMPAKLVFRFLLMPFLFTVWYFGLNSYLIGLPFQIQVLKLIILYISFFVINLLISLAIFITADFFMRRKCDKILFKNPRAVIRDMNFEKTVLKRAECFYVSSVFLTLLGIYGYHKWSFMGGI